MIRRSIQTGSDVFQNGAQPFVTATSRCDHPATAGTASYIGHQRKLLSGVLRHTGVSIHTLRRKAAEVVLIPLPPGAAVRSAVAGGLNVTALADCYGDPFPPLLVVLIDELLDRAKHDRLGIDADTIGG